MNILVTASTFPRWSNDTVPAFVEDQVKFLQELHPEHQYFVLAPHDPGASFYEKRGMITVLRFPYMFPIVLEKLVYTAIWPNIKANPLLIAEIPFLLVAGLWAIVRTVKKYKIDMIYAHWFMPMGMLSMVAGLLLRKKCVLTTHTSDVLVMKKIPVLGKLIVRFLLPKFYAISAVSKRSQDKMKVFFHENEWQKLLAKIAVIPMGVNIKEFENHPKVFKNLQLKYQTKGKKVILFIGRLVEKKGVEYLIQALSTIPSNYKLLIAGDGPQESAIRLLVAKLKLQNHVQFLGFVTGKRKLELFQLADILVVPSIITKDGDAEGLPVALMEGMAAGKICIATRTSGADEIISHQENGYLVDEKDIKQLREAIDFCLSLKTQKARQISESAKKQAMQFHWPKIAEHHYQHLLDVQQK